MGASMRSPKIGVSELKDVSILFEGDIYDLAVWLLRLDLALTTPTSIPRHTLHGLANHYAFLARMEISKVEEAFARGGLPTTGMIERDEDVR